MLNNERHLKESFCEKKDRSINKFDSLSSTVHIAILEMVNAYEFTKINEDISPNNIWMVIRHKEENRMLILETKSPNVSMCVPQQCLFHLMTSSEIFHLLATGPCELCESCVLYDDRGALCTITVSSYNFYENKYWISTMTTTSSRSTVSSKWRTSDVRLLFPPAFIRAKANFYVEWYSSLNWLFYTWI